MNQISTLIKSPKTPVERRFRYLLGVLTGLRDGEVSGLRFNSITDEDGSGPTIHVDEALALVSIGKGYGFQAPKTEDSVRLVPVHGLLGEALGWWRSTGWPTWVGRKAKDSDVIFPNEKGKPWRPRSAEHLRTDLAAAGLATTFGTGKRAKDFTFHVLRATFATLLADAEVESSLRSVLLGHVPQGVSERHYTAATLRRLRAAIERLSLPLCPADLSSGLVQSLVQKGSACTKPARKNARKSSD